MSNKWADYAITVVRFNAAKTHIDKVKRREDRGEKLGAAARARYLGCAHPNRTPRGSLLVANSRKLGSLSGIRLGCGFTGDQIPRRTSARGF